MHQGSLRQCEIFEILRIEISLERACLELSVVVCQSYQDGKKMKHSQQHQYQVTTEGDE